jgi:CRISPR-associated protein Cmr1
VIERSYRLSFNTPAFLGNAQQTAQWRTPPIKALLRQWWRVAYAADQASGVDIARMRRAEGELFGVAADSEGDSRRSRLRLRLSRWDAGRMTSWSGQDSDRVTHPEVKNREGRVTPVGAHLYLGFGPLVFDRQQGQTALKSGAAIQAKEDARLAIAFPAGEEAIRLARALWLLHHYGTLGGRSRNGWGSFSLTPADAATPSFGDTLDAGLTLPWIDALKRDWPQAIGTDAAGPLIWQTEAMADWKAVMRRLAEIKIALRTQFKFNSGKNASAPESRHWLSYPVTNHSVRDWGNNARLPNSLRFKVRAQADGKLRGVIFHVPCLPPPQFSPDRAAITAVWQQVHRHLSETARLQRILA